VSLKKYFVGTTNLLVFIAIAYASYLLILLSLPYIHFERNVDFLKTKQLIYHLKYWRVSFYIHVFTSPVVIISGLFQFNRWILKNHARIHRISGYAHILTVIFITGPAAFIMSLWANGGRIAQLSFVLLSILWILFTYLAYHHVKKGSIDRHAKWMLRSYALTLSAVTLRFYAYLFDVFNLDLGPKETYILLAYIAWIPNLLIAEILIKLGYTRYLLLLREA
jgi:uncharacterized membrane protein